MSRLSVSFQGLGVEALRQSELLAVKGSSMIEFEIIL